MRLIVFWGLYWGPPYLGKLPHTFQPQFVQGTIATDIDSDFLCIEAVPFPLPSTSPLLFEL